MAEVRIGRKPMHVKTGKSSGDISQLVQGYVEQNDSLLADAQRINEIYRQQPARPQCMCCRLQIPGKPTFVKQGIGYSVCAQCGHLNGVYLDTPEFCAQVYGDPKYYANFYKPMDRDAFQARVSAIYRPKAEFLFDALSKQGARPQELRYTDFGAGSGYFVAALLASGVKECEGLELSEGQVRQGNSCLPEPCLKPLLPERTYDALSEIQSEVVSMVGVLEHLQDPRRALQALASNPRVKFLLISVPLLSPSVLFELAFPQVFERHLSGDHTHLYTASSLRWLEKEFGLKRIGEWWFGADMVDLYRQLRVTFAKSDEMRGATALLDELLRPAVDALQLSLDERRLSSEVHLVYRLRD